LKECGSGVSPVLFFLEEQARRLYHIKKDAKGCWRSMQDELDTCSASAEFRDKTPF
jgi:hypothetical protein